MLIFGCEAKFISCDRDDKKDFNCPVCTRYIVEIAAESILKEKDGMSLDELRLFAQEAPDKEKAGFMVDIVNGNKDLPLKYYDIDWGL